METEGRSAIRNEHTTLWLLLILRGAHLAGLAPVAVPLAHRLLFLTNSLAHVYQQVAPSDFVLKHRRGPYYPDAQFTFERLAVQGLVDLGPLRWDRSHSFPEIETEFSLSHAGTELLKHLANASRWCNEVMAFTTDLCAAVATVEDGEEIETMDEDLTYAQSWAKQNTVIPFRYEEQRLSGQAIREFTNLAPDSLQPNRQHLLRLYLKYLEKVADAE